MTSTFWGLRLEAGKRYSTIVDKSFHVSMAALDCTTVKSEKEVHSIMLEEGESNIPFILCNLQKPKVTQCLLNLNFVSGDRVTFFCRGNGTVHLTGYLMLEEDDEFGGFGEEGDEVEEEEDEEEEEEDEEEEEGVEDEDMETVKGKSKLNGLSGKRKADQAKGNQKKQPKLDEESEQEVESASDLDSEDNALIGPDESEEDEAETDEESEEPEEEIEPQQQQKKNKKQNNQPLSPSQQKQQKQGTSQLKQQQANGPQQKKQEKKQGNEEKPAVATPGKKTLSGGVVVKDLKLGNGPVCKSGKMVSVYYVGRLKSNNKVFDKLTQGKGFKFRLGKDEVIKGWDIGVAGMKVGGKRLITCPPDVAYGEDGSPPTIPPKSTLIFEIELKSVF